MRKFRVIPYLLPILLLFVFTSCSLYEGIEIPGYIAVGLTVVFLVFVVIWFLRRLKR